MWPQSKNGALNQGSRSNEEDVSIIRAQIDVNVLIDDILGFKTYDKYKDAWIYEWNKDVSLVAIMPWLDYGPWMEPSEDIKHVCKLFYFKNGYAKWPTCNYKKEKYCSCGDLPGVIRKRDVICFESYEWIFNDYAGTNNDYETQGNELWFDEHELIRDDDDDISDLEDYLIQKDQPYYVNEYEQHPKREDASYLEFLT
nr:hypothetical protein [Tanacetum cinerariifolium]